MDDGLNHRLQSTDTWFVRIRYVQTEKIGHSPVEENRLAIRRQPPEMTGDHIDELRELPLSLTQCGLGAGSRG